MKTTATLLIKKCFLKRSEAAISDQKNLFVSRKSSSGYETIPDDPILKLGQRLKRKSAASSLRPRQLQTITSLVHVSDDSISDVSAVFVEDVSDLTLQSNFAPLAQLEIKPYLVKQISWFSI